MKQAASVGFVYSAAAVAAANRLPSNIMRSRMVNSMILDAFLLGQKMRLIEPSAASAEDLENFHSSEFVRALLTAEKKIDSEAKDDLDFLEEFGLLHDCPVFMGLSDYVKYVAGGTLAAARSLVDGSCSVAIYWDGGRHHAQYNLASGFCYVNDIVLGIMELHRGGLENVLYIDLDVHHGDGVESAFEYSSNVYRMSFHIFEPGFFPGTGSSIDTGSGCGKNHALNIPLAPDTSTAEFLAAFSFQLTQVLTRNYPSPNAIVLQCGLDGCRGDPLVPNGWKLDTFAIGDCVEILLNQVITSGASIPVLLLGGGGYSNVTAARGWTYATMKAIQAFNGGRRDSLDEVTDWRELLIPEHTYLDQYAPEFSLFG
ncbi:hypothetical protein BDR26DRAFT_910581 [Obelidium mucronatum]|nr:hypothetical protein BDR26DRAFT_910581 [Obelidium mucronatum]